MLMLDSEKELENFLYFDESGIFTPTGDDYDLCLQQVSLPGYGTMDLVFIGVSPTEGTIKIHIVELKKEKLDIGAVGQIARYRQGVLRYLKSLNIPESIFIDVVGTLIGREFSGDDVNYLIDSIQWLDCFTYSLSLAEGISFKNQTCIGYHSIRWHSTNTERDKILPAVREIKRCYLTALRTENDIAEHMRLRAQKEAANA